MSDLHITPDMAKAYARNQAWVAPGGNQNYSTQLPPFAEANFRTWVASNSIPFNPDAPVQDYDMRGFWQALQSGDERATRAVDPNDNRLHFPDYWKTPYHETFSAESQWADPAKAPKWNEQDQLVAPNGSVVFDDKAAALQRLQQTYQSKMATMAQARGTGS